MPKKLLHHYLPYAVIDLFMIAALLTEWQNDNLQLLWANVPVLLMGLWSFSRKINLLRHDSDN